MKRLTAIMAVMMAFILTVGTTTAAAFAADETISYEVSSSDNALESDIPEDAIIIDLDDLEVSAILDTATLAELYAEDEAVLEAFLETLVLMELGAAAVEAYNVLMQDFKQEIDGMLDLVYPDNYAGAYLDHDTLVIQLTDTSSEATAFYRDLLGPDAPIRFKQVDYSINQLVAFGDIFVDVIDAPIVSYGFSTMDNTFRIALDQNSPESLQAADSFNQHSRFFPIPVTIELEAPAELAELRGGHALRLTQSPALLGGEFSVGITGTRWHTASGVGGERATLLTTGHALRFAQIGTVVFDRNGTEIGTLAMFRFAHLSGGSNVGQHGDWALIDLNAAASQRVTNMTQTGNSIRRSLWHVPVGFNVIGTGRSTISYHGTITHVNQSVSFHPWGTPTGLTIVRPTLNSFPAQGDSGGPIWYNDPIDGSVFVGVSAGVAEDRSQWYFSPVGWVTSNFFPTLW